MSHPALAVLQDETLPFFRRVETTLPLLTGAQQRLFAADCAVRALIRARESGREPDPRSWEAVRVTRDVALGTATLKELRVAQFASLSASRAAAWSRTQSSSAARSAWFAAATWDASAFSAAKAAKAAEDTLSNSGFVAEERQAQVRRMVELIESGVGS